MKKCDLCLVFCVQAGILVLSVVTTDPRGRGPREEPELHVVPSCPAKRTPHQRASGRTANETFNFFLEAKK